MTKLSEMILVNNTSADIRTVESSIIQAIKSGNPLPEELADIFTLEIIEAEDGIRGVLNHC